MELVCYYLPEIGVVSASLSLQVGAFVQANNNGPCRYRYLSTANWNTNSVGLYRTIHLSAKEKSLITMAYVVIGTDIRTIHRS
jgi:hypothetical protein